MMLAHVLKSYEVNERGTVNIELGRARSWPILRTNPSLVWTEGEAWKALE
jgi:hypothetical protein